MGATFSNLTTKPNIYVELKSQIGKNVFLNELPSGTCITLALNDCSFKKCSLCKRGELFKEY